MTKDKFISDILYFKFLMDNNLPADYKSQHIDDDDLLEDREPKEAVDSEEDQEN